MTNLTGSNLNRREATGPKGEGRDSPSNFPKYPEYKDSGVEWLGEVPAHWDIKPLKYVATYNDEVLPESTPDDYLIKYVEISDVDEQIGITGWSEHSFSSAPSRARRVLKDGDVLISTVRTYLRAIAPVIDPPENLIGSTGFAAIRPLAGQYDSALMGYALRAEWFISKVISNSVGVSYPAINATDLARFDVPVPPLSEQAIITTFLDHETARIDTLVEQQQRLIELLKEKRQAVISHAVTKGLDPDVPMKDSGVEWLGEVPAHWSLPKKLDHIALDESNSFVNGPFGSDLLASELKSSGVPVVYIRDLKLNGYTRISEQFVTQEKAKQIAFCNVLPGDVLVAKVGDPPGLAVTYPENEPNGVVTQDVIRIRPSTDRADPRFLAYVINSDAGRYSIDQISVVSTRTRVSLGDFKQLRFCWPPVGEQERISDFLDHELASIFRLINEAYKVVKLLAERRSALISATVTGKIDVRDWKLPVGSLAPFEAAQTEMV